MHTLFLWRRRGQAAFMGEEGRIQERPCLKSFWALSCNFFLCLESKEFRILSKFLHKN